MSSQGEATGFQLVNGHLMAFEATVERIRSCSDIKLDKTRFFNFNISQSASVWGKL